MILPGRIAQRAERPPYTREVTGSIPVPPTGVVVKLVYNAGLSRRRPRVRIPSTPPQPGRSLVMELHYKGFLLGLLEKERKK